MINGIATEAMRPDTNAMRPDTNAMRPDTNAMRPDTNAMRPDTNAMRPDTNAMRPDTKAMPFDTKAMPFDTKAMPFAIVVRLIIRTPLAGSMFRQRPHHALTRRYGMFRSRQRKLVAYMGGGLFRRCFIGDVSFPSGFPHRQ